MSKEAMQANGNVQITTIAAEAIARNTPTSICKPLTDEQMLELLPTVQLKNEKPIPMVWLTRKDALIFARSVEAAHGIKGENT